MCKINPSKADFHTYFLVFDLGSYLHIGKGSLPPFGGISDFNHLIGLV